MQKRYLERLGFNFFHLQSAHQRQHEGVLNSGVDVITRHSAPHRLPFLFCFVCLLQHLFDRVVPLHICVKCQAT